MSPSSTIQPQVRVGVGVFILRPSQSASTSTPSSIEFVIGRRLGSHGANTWALPGGHLEFNETFEECAIREVQEETGLEVRNVRFLTATNDVMSSEKKHYITCFVVAELEHPAAEPEVCEPLKCAGWEWVGWEELTRWVDRLDQEGEEEWARGKLFLPLVNIVRQRPGIVPSLL